MEFNATYLNYIMQVALIDIVLSGDNAVVIAMACRSLPPRQYKIGVAAGIGGALALRIIFAALIVWLLAIPYIKIVGGLVLLYIAYNLVKGEGEEKGHKEPVSNLWKAIWTVVVADAMMSFDNVVAISAAAHGYYSVFIFGLILSMPLMILGASVISKAIERFPVIVWAGGALLGWVAGEMVVTDPKVHASIHDVYPQYLTVIEYCAAATGAVFVVVSGLIAVNWSEREDCNAD